MYLLNAEKQARLLQSIAVSCGCSYNWKCSRGHS